MSHFFWFFFFYHNMKLWRIDRIFKSYISSIHNQLKWYMKGLIIKISISLFFNICCYIRIFVYNSTVNCTIVKLWEIYEKKLAWIDLQRILQIKSHAENYMAGWRSGRLISRLNLLFFWWPSLILLYLCVHYIKE